MVTHLRVISDEGRVITECFGGPHTDTWGAIQREIAQFMGERDPDLVTLDDAEDADDGQIVLCRNEYVGRFSEASR